MPSPSEALSTLRPDLGGSLEEFDLAMDRQGFIGHRVLPVFEAASQSGVYGKIPLAELLQARDTRRGPGGNYNRGAHQFEPETYACEEHGLEEAVDDRESQMYAQYFDAEVVAAQRALDGVLREAEKRIAAAVFNATTWTSYTTGITHEWDDATNAVPLTDVETAAQAVYSQCGMWPNALIINRKVFRNLRNVDQVVDRIKYAGITDPRAGAITEAAMAQAFDIDEIIVAGSAKNTADEGATASLSPIWSDEYAMVARICRTNDIREPGVGRTIHWAADGSSIGGTVESYRAEDIRSDIVRVRHDVDEVILYVAAGHLLSNVTT